RRGVRGAQAVEVGAVLAAERDEVREAGGGDERGAGHLALEERVGGHRHAVREGLDVGRVAVRALERRAHRGHHAARLVAGRARLQLIPSGADAAPWSVGPANCAQDQRSYAVSCTGDSAPLTIQAGGGADVVDGSASPVALNIDGGPGQDYLTGSPGDDTFMVRDGEDDIVDCGAGQDRVVADAADAL